MNISSNKIDTVFVKSISDYHLTDNVDALPVDLFESGTLESLLYQKNWIDVVQWHLEDLIRDEAISPEKALVLKRRIDASNQERTDVVEQLDDFFFSLFSEVTPQKGARINTETPGWALDRLSILDIKIYHFEQETRRTDASALHLKTCSDKLEVLTKQHQYLCKAIDGLLDEMSSGKCIALTFKQMKMYNDKELNPVLRKSAK